MPRKPKLEKKTIAVVVNEAVVSVTLYPPEPPRTSWYAYWPGLVASRSTGQQTFNDAALVAENMVRNGGKKYHPKEAALSDGEFEEIQRRHFGKKKDPAAKARADSTLRECLDAISAFKAISGLSLITQATPDDCERFQNEALTKPRNWRKQYPKSKKEGVQPITPNTVVKWSRALQAAFERANRNAGRKCVRGVVNESKLLSSNPWKQFTWIDGTVPTKRRFSSEELISLLDYFETKWPEVVVAALFAKVSLWIWGRRSEVASLRWGDLHSVNNQHHFDFVGKWGVRKWARIPEGLYQQLVNVRTDSPFVFAAYNEQLRRHYVTSKTPFTVQKVGHQYQPTAFADWFHDKLVEWSASSPNGHATQHAFRKTGLQFAYRGGVADAKVAHDASITSSVMLDHYVDESTEELLLKSNRTFDRIVSCLPIKAAQRYGYLPELEGVPVADVLKAAIERQEWGAARELLEQLTRDAAKSSS